MAEIEDARPDLDESTPHATPPAGTKRLPAWTMIVAMVLLAAAFAAVIIAMVPSPTGAP